MPCDEENEDLREDLRVALKSLENSKRLSDVLMDQVMMMQKDIVRSQKWRSLSVRIMQPWQAEEVKAKMFEWENEQE